MRWAAVPPAVHRWRERFGDRRTLGHDVKAGIVLGAESVPDGLAAGLLAGVSPVHGLYAYLAGTFGGALATGSVLMSVQTTGAMGVIVSDVPEVQASSTSAHALATLALLTGAVMVVLGALRLGSLVRFIPTAVLTGFVNAVAVNIVLGQLSNVTGYDGAGSNRVVRAVDTLGHLASWSWPTVAVALITAWLTLMLERTRLGPMGMVLAVIIASGLAAVVPALDVERLGDSVSVPSSLPHLVLPSGSLVLPLLVPALSLALVGLVQGAAISGAVPNPNGEYGDPSADFRGQGVANLLAGAMQGMPVGGSMSATALVREAGARTATANVVAAIVMAATVLVAAPAIAYTAMPALGALLVVIGARTLNADQLVMVWRTGTIQATVLLVTFVMTLVIPLQYAVLAGVGIAVVLHVSRQSNRVELRRWIFDDGVLPREIAPPEELSAGDVVVLVPYGSLFFAAAPKVEEQLPRPGQDASGAHVVLRLRGSEELGATAIGMLVSYASRLRDAGATLVLAGVGPRVADQLDVTGAAAQIGEENLFRATDRLGDALRAALEEVARRTGSAEGDAPRSPGRGDDQSETL